MSRAAALARCVATLAAAATLALVGYDLLSLPHHSRVADAIVGGADVRRFASATRLFEGALDSRTASNADFARRARAEAALAAQRGDAHVRSRAQTLLGVLVYTDALVHENGGSAAGAAADAFRNALRLDPDNEQAAINLELLLTQSRRGRTAPSQGAGPRPGREHGQRGTRSGQNGDGY
jgi:hypothetical protein